MNDRGFAIVGLDSPKFAENIGGVLRACGAYGVAQVNISRCRAKHLDVKENTSKAHRHMPTFIVDDPLEYLPWGTEIVAVDLVDDAVPLPTFIHPERAIYVFGAEDRTLDENILSRAHHRVMIPTRNCMNLAATVNVVLYDRLAKSAPFNAAYPSATSAKPYVRKSA